MYSHHIQKQDSKVVALIEMEYNSLCPGILFCLISIHKKYLQKKATWNPSELDSPSTFPQINNSLSSEAVHIFTTLENLCCKEWDILEFPPWHTSRGVSAPLCRAQRLAEAPDKRISPSFSSLRVPWADVPSDFATSSQLAWGLHVKRGSLFPLLTGGRTRLKNQSQRHFLVLGFLWISFSLKQIISETWNHQEWIMLL